MPINPIFIYLLFWILKRNFAKCFPSQGNFEGVSNQCSLTQTIKISGNLNTLSMCNALPGHTLIFNARNGRVKEYSSLICVNQSLLNTCIFVPYLGGNYCIENTSVYSNNCLQTFPGRELPDTHKTLFKVFCKTLYFPD